MLRFSILVLAISVTSAQWPWFGSQINCRRYQHSDCDTYSTNEECGSDGVTYRNRCAFTQAHCHDTTIDVLYHAACDNRTLVGGPALSGPEAVLDFFCTEVSHEDCPADQEAVCGVDGVTYTNYCEFEKTRCTHRDLKVLTFGPCPVATQ